MKTRWILAVILGALLLGISSYAEDRVVGIGVVLGVKDNAIKIVKVLPNTPASRAGLTTDLIIQKVDGTAVEGKYLKDCVDLMRGAAGTKIKLVLVDTANSKTNTVELTREKIL